MTFDISNKYNTLLISEEDSKLIFSGNISKPIELVESALKKRNNNEVILPNKISQIFDQRTQNRINCLPATLVSDGVCGMKWVSVFPENPLHGIRNVTGLVILSELEHGLTLSVMDGTYMTSIRTAAIGAVAAKHLAKKTPETIGFIGAGQEARNHLDMIKFVKPTLKKCFVSSRRSSTVEEFIRYETKIHPDIEFVNCADNYKKASENADIIVTATSSQLKLLKAEYIKDGALYIHVGGIEDEYAVAEKANKIICDEWESVKHRSQTISCMYKEGKLSDDDIYANIGEIVSQGKNGRESEDEFIYFCSVGLSFIDVTFAKYIYDEARRRKIGTEYRF